MPRQELANTFSDGMMKDLNPINTPKSVLTDCLNGTYITYNGNEFVLQNDMGNYKLQNCKLPTNFIPVGVKGYADILYIVSYNPFTEEVEIGSYPAPQSIFTTGDTPTSEVEDLEAFDLSKQSRYRYNDIITSQKKALFVFMDGSNQDAYKLYPGDEFKLDELDNQELPFIYQHLNFYVIDEDNKLYDIDDVDIYDYSGPVSEDGFRKVFWETPGWLATQYDLYVPDKFNLNLKSLNVPEFLVTSDDSKVRAGIDPNISMRDQDDPNGNMKISMDLSSQIIISDLLFQEELNKHFNIENPNAFDHLYVRYLIRTDQNYGTFIGIEGDQLTSGPNKEDNTWERYLDAKTYTKSSTEPPEGNFSYIDIPCKKHNYQDDIITAYTNAYAVWSFVPPAVADIASYEGVVELHAFPVIKYNNQELEYYQFATSYRFPLNTLKDSSKINIANSIYKWSVDDDSCTISFNIDGPFINASDITGKYEIYRINLFKKENEPTSRPNLDNPISVSTWNGIDSFQKITSDDWEVVEDELVNGQSLMCQGTISNLVLYGQNTLNIDWNNSNKAKLLNYHNWYTNPDWDSTQPVDEETNPYYKEDTGYVGYQMEGTEENRSNSKTIDFSKEGGIYIFRVILEQNGSTLNTTDKILIPSEVFNEWFGSIDNYDNIYLNQWVEKIINLSTISQFNLFSYNYNINTQSTDAIYGYKINNQINKNNIDSREDILNLFPINGTDETTNHLFSQSQNGIVKIIIDYNKLIQSLSFIYNKTQALLQGNLINPKYVNFLTLKQNNSEIFIGEEEVIDSSNMNLKNIQILNLSDINLQIQSSTTTHQQLTKVYPFKNLGYGKSNQLVILIYHHYHGDRDGVSGQFYYWKNDSETGAIGGGASAKNQGRILFDGSTLCSDPIGKMDDYNVGYAQLAAKNFANNCGSSSVNANKGVGELARVTSTDWRTAAFSGLPPIAWGNGGTTFDEGRESQDKFLLFRAYNKNSSGYHDATVAINLNSFDQKQTFCDLLEKIYIQEIGENTITYYVPTILTTSVNLLNELNISINKVNIQTLIKLLTVDDHIYLFNTLLKNIEITNASSNLLMAKVSNINNYTWTYNLSISPITINLNWLTNNQFSALYYNLEDAIREYNEISASQSESEAFSGNFSFDDDSSLSPQHRTALQTLTTEKLKFKNGVPTVNNISWNISSWNYLVLRNFRRNGGYNDVIDNTGVVFMTYVEDFTI